MLFRVTMAARHDAAAQEPPHLVLEDVSRDGFRREFFLSAFGDEKDALELCFAFLGHVRKYKTLVGRKELLQNIVRL